MTAHIEKLFKLQDIVYDTGARNFLFFNLPPMHRAPGGKPLADHYSMCRSLLVAPQRLKGGYNRYMNWNTQLETALEAFAAKHTDATVLLFSSWDTFTRVLDNPTQFGFAESDPDTECGGIWVDHMHPTSDMHEIIARDLASFIASVPTTKGIS